MGLGTSSPNAASTFSVVMTNHKIPTEMSKSPLVRGNIKSPPIENHWKRVMPEDTTEQPHWRLASQVALVVKNLPANAGDTTDTDSIPGSGKEWQPTPVFLPGESHGQRCRVGYNPEGHKESDMTEPITHIFSSEAKPSSSSLALDKGKYVCSVKAAVLCYSERQGYLFSDWITRKL